MALATLLGNLSPTTFVEEFFLRLPVAMPNCARGFISLGSWDVLSHLISQVETDVMVVREGQRSMSARPLSIDGVRSLLGEGHTVLVRHAERGHDALAQLAKEFSTELGAPVDIHLYATPPDRHGFGWHYDVEDVFILQTVGTKEYLLRKNTVNPWPLLETLPADMRYGRELMPLIRCDLEPGDWLYIPNGYWHRAVAKTESLSLAIGLTPATGIDALDFAREQSLESLRWRQRLPASGAATGSAGSEAESPLRQRLADLADDIRDLLTSPTFERLLLERLRDRSTGHLVPPLKSTQLENI
jgi:ribosomal protein L16 Arg81 hydroxylase